MVKQYRDIARKKIADKPSVSINLPTPNTKILSAQSDAMLDLINTFRKDYVANAQRKASEQGVIDGSNVEITYDKNGVPEYAPQELGGTFYNEAYRKASRARYEQALSNSVDTKLNEALKTWGEAGNERDVEGLKAIMGSKFNAMLETVDPSFSGFLRAEINNKTNAQITLYEKQRINENHAFTVQSAVNAVENTKKSFANDLLLTNTPEFNERVKKLEEELITLSSLDKTYNEEKINIELQSVVKTAQINQLMLDLGKRDDKGKFITSQAEIRKMIDLLETGNGTAKFGDKEYTQKWFTDNDITRAEKSSIITRLTLHAKNRNAVALNYIKKIKPEITTTINLLEEKVITLLSNGKIEEAQNTLDTFEFLPELSELPKTEADNLALNNTIDSAKQKLQSLITKDKVAENVKETNLVLEDLVQDLNNNIANDSSEELLERIDKIIDIRENPTLSKLKNDITNNPDQFIQTQALINQLNEIALTSTVPDNYYNMAINILNGQGTNIESSNILGKSPEELIEAVGPFRDFLVQRLEEIKKENSNTGGPGTSAFIASDFFSSNPKQIHTVSSGTTAVNEYLKNMTIDDLNKPYTGDPNNPINVIINAFKNNKVGLSKNSKMNEFINVALNSGNFDYLNNIAIPLYKGLSQNFPAKYLGSDKNKYKLDFLSNLSISDLQKFSNAYKTKSAKGDGIRSLWDQMARPFLQATNTDTGSTFENDPSTNNAMKRFRADSEATKKILKVFEDATNISSAKKNQLIDPFVDRMYYAGIGVMIMNDTVDEGQLNDFIETEANKFIESRNATLQLSAPSANEDILMQTNNQPDKAHSELHNKYGKLLEYWDSEEVPSNTAENAYSLIDQLKENIANGNIPKEIFTDDNVIDDSDPPLWGMTWGQIAKGAYTVAEMTLPPSGVNQAISVARKVKDAFATKKEEFDVKAINGDVNLNMNSNVNLLDHFSIEGVPLIPGKNVFFETKNNQLIGYFSKGNELIPIVNTKENNESFVFNTPIQDPTRSIVLKRERIEDAKTFDIPQFNLGQTGKAFGISENQDKSISEQIPSLSNKANLNKQESFITNNKRAFLTSGIVDKNTAKQIIKKDYVINTGDSQFTIVPSQRLNNDLTIENITLQEATLIAQTSNNKLPTYKTEREANNRVETINNVINEDIDDLVGGGSADPVPELMNITAKGQTVVDNTIDVINRVLPMGKWETAMMKGIAITESKNGTDPRTFLPNRGSIGIWQLDKGTPKTSMFQDLKRRYKEYQANNSKHNLFGRNVEKITEALKKEGYDFNLATMTYKQLQQPINNGAIVRLFLTLYKTSDYNSLEKAGPFWKNNFNTLKGKGKTQDFLDKAAKYYEGL